MLKQMLIFVLALVISFSTHAQPPKVAVSLFKSGKQMIQQGLFYNAIQNFRKATTIYKNYDSAFLEWSNIYIRINKPDSSIYVWNLAIKQSPKMLLAYKTLGRIYRDNKSQYDSAKLYYSKVLKIDSTDKENFYNVSWCCNATKDFDNAIIYAIKALGIDVNYRPAYGELAHAYRNNRKMDEGLATFKKYAALSTSEQPLFYCGMIYLETNQYDKLQETIDELNKKGAKSSADGLKKRWDIKKNAKPTQSLPN